MNRDEAISTLLDLVKVCRNNQHRYEVAAVSSTDHQLAALLEHYALRREEYALHLADITRIMGGYLDTGNGTSPTHTPVRLNLESTLRPESERAAIAECERGEAQALRCYLDALAFDLPKQVLHILGHQYEQTRIAYVYISNLRDAASSCTSSQGNTGTELIEKLFNHPSLTVISDGESKIVEKRQDGEATDLEQNRTNVSNVGCGYSGGGCGSDTRRQKTQ